MSIRFGDGVISHLHRCIFCHIPRTGGTTVEEILWPHPLSEKDLWMGFRNRYGNEYHTGGLQHLPARKIKQRIGNDLFANYFKFSMIRNPWDRSVSQYESMKLRPDLREMVGMTQNAPFARYLDLIARHRHVQWEPQCDFLFDQDGKLLLDFVGRYERFEGDLRKILSRLGVSCSLLPRTNATVRGHYVDYYNDECHSKHQSIYARDIKVLGYKFNPSMTEHDAQVPHFLSNP